MKRYAFTPPDFSRAVYQVAPNVRTETVQKDGIAPSGFYLTSHMPTYYKVDGEWVLPARSSLNCVAVLKDGVIKISELRDLKKGDEVVMGKARDASLGVLEYGEGFAKGVINPPGISVETSNTPVYEELFELMKWEKENDGYIVWVLGPAVVFDHDTRLGLSRLAECGYVHSLLGGNAMATHDLEGGYLNTALGQDIYTQVSVPMGHYNHLDLLNEVRRAGSIDEFIAAGNVKDGFVKTLKMLDVPIVLAGSVRDDGPLPEVTSNCYESLTSAKAETDKATLIICMATMLHSISTAELASSYRLDAEGKLVPVFLYTVDVTENAVNKVAAARDGLAVRTLVTNVQDFVVNAERALVPESARARASEPVAERQYLEIRQEKMREADLSADL